MAPAEFERSTAFAPGHVTGIFRPESEGRDPRARGSVGAGLVLELGASAIARWSPGPARSVRVRDASGGALPISETVVRRLVGDRRGRCVVLVRHDLPVGQGFGMSAAGSLAAGLAVAPLVGRSTQSARETAHLAELFGGGGLGGVAAILGGGLEVRDRPGVPPWGHVTHTASDRVVFVGTVTGPIPSPEILADARWLRRIRSAALPLDRLGPRTEWDEFWAASEAFTDRVGLAPPSLRSLLRGLRRRGVPAAQAMFGGSFFADLGAGSTRARAVEFLTRAGARGAELRLAVRGARAGRRRPPAGRPA